MRALLLFIIILLSSCQRSPAWAPAADPMSSIVPPPMGATTYNDELKKELVILDDLLNQKLDPKKVNHVKSSLINGNNTGLLFGKTDESYLAKIYLNLPELVSNSENLSANRKSWFKAKFLFLQRRFIEAAELMSEVLRVEPDFTIARNWRARAIFFLGNPDLAISELQKIVKQNPKSESSLDALYLIGAIVFESNDHDSNRIKTGIAAWQSYLKQAIATPELTKEINDSLGELHIRLKGSKEQSLGLVTDPFSPKPNNSPEKNAILSAFMKEELLHAEQLAELLLTKNYDQDIAIIKARIFIKTGRIDEAAELFEHIIKKSPNYAPAFHYRGMSFMMKSKVKEAIASWQKAAELDKFYAQAHKLDQRIAIAQKMIGP